MDFAAFAHFDPIISVVIRISFSLKDKHCSDDSGCKIQFGAGKNPWTDISPNPSSSYMYTAAAKILERFQEYPRRGSRRHKTAHPRISLLRAPIYCIAPNLPPTGIHQTIRAAVYTHPIVTTVVMILSNFLSQKDMDSHSRFKFNNCHSQGQCHPNPHSFQNIPHQLTFNLYNLFVLPDVYIVLMT